MPTFSADQLKRVSSSIFEAAGVPADEARVVAESLINSNLAGHDSHGAICIPQHVSMEIFRKVVKKAESYRY